jgi:hypothetical protein
LGISLPDHLSVKIVKEKENEVVLVITQNAQQEDEITQSELESVSGGWSGDGCIGTFGQSFRGVLNITSFESTPKSQKPLNPLKGTFRFH